jgi:hypothetical protein
MGGKKAIGIVVLVVGIIVLLVSVFAYPIGLGGPGFGPKQIAGTIVGAIVAIVGLTLVLRG